MPVEVVLLGPPGIRVAGGRRPVPGRQRALLAVLALAAPRVVSSDRLVEALWGDELPGDPVNALQQRVSALRKLVDPERTGTVLVPAAGGYRLQVADDAVDARRFEHLAARGSEHLRAGDAAAALQLLREGLALWEGDVLEGFADEPWARPEVQRLTELRLTAREDRIDAALALGGGAELVGELADLHRAYPLRERVAGQRMVACYRAGRQAEALEVYDVTRRRLAEELGVDPSPELRAIHLQILDQDASLLAGTSGAETPMTTGQGARTSAGAAGNLPAPTTTVIGRTRDLDQLGELLTQRRLVTLTGPGGAGKTTLALAAAHAQPPPPDGRWLVELGFVADGSGVVDAVAATLGHRSAELDATGDPIDALAARLRETRALLVLDNCEHVVDAAAALVSRLLAAAPELRVLATTREPLGVAGEVVWSIPPLGLPDADASSPEAIGGAPAVALLLARGRDVVPDLELTPDTAPLAATLARRLDGVPLAIELAAARLRTLSLPELVAGLDDRFAVLTSRVRGAPSRQRTLRGTLDWSWDLLDRDLQQAWAALSVPTTWFAVADAAHLLDAAGVQRSPLDVVTDLVDRSLVVADVTTTPARYRLLETIRAYGRERLVDLGLGDPVHARHAERVDAALVACRRDDPRAFPVDLAGLAAVLDEARAVLVQAETDDDRAAMARIAGQLGWLWLLGGLSREGLRWLDRALGPDPSELDPAHVDADAARFASALRATRAHPDAARWAALSLAVEQSPADRIVSRVFAAVHHLHGGAVARSLDELEATVADAVPIGGWPLGFAHLMTAQLARLAGRQDLVAAHAEPAYELATATAVDWARVQAIDILIDGLDSRGEHARARDLATEGLELCRELALPELEARLHLQLGVALHELGEPERARTHLTTGVQLTGRGGPSPSLGFAELVAGTVARRRGDLAEARTRLTTAVDLLRETATPFGSAWAEVERALTDAAEGAVSDAQDHALAALELAAEMHEPGMLARALEALATAHATSAPRSPIGPDREPARARARDAGSDTDHLELAHAARALARRVRDEGGQSPSDAEQRDLDRLDDVLARTGTEAPAGQPADAAPVELATAVSRLLERARGSRTAHAPRTIGTSSPGPT